MSTIVNADIETINLPIIDGTTTPQQRRDIEGLCAHANTYCRGNINKDYLTQLTTSALPDDAVSRVIYIGAEVNTLRAFAIVTKYADHYYIDLICCASSAGVRTRQQALVRSLEQQINGKTLLSQIKEDAIKTKMKYIELSALDSVISYYHDQGYRFIQNCNMTEKAWTADDITKLRDIQKRLSSVVTDLTDVEEEQLDAETKELLTSREFLKQIPGMYTEDNLNLKPKPKEETDAEKLENGYSMILCLENDMDTSPGGGRAQKRKTRRKTRKYKRSGPRRKRTRSATRSATRKRKPRGKRSRRTRRH